MNVLTKLLPDKIYLKMMFKRRFGKKLNLKNPKSFNEKLQWLKLYDRKAIYSSMADKNEAKKYVSSRIGKEYIIPTIGVYDKFEDIDFEKLPNQFVIKCTHDSGGVVVCTDKTKIDLGRIRKKINRTLKRNYYYGGREWPYKNIKRRIIVEKYMEDSATKELRDYKVFCFNGKAKFFKIDFDRFKKHRANYYDLSGNILEFSEEAFPPDLDRDIEIPSSIKKIIALSEKLSNGFSFLRVDWYVINGKIYFGELTFYPTSGFGRIVPSGWDERIGEMLVLRSNRR